VNCTWFEVNLAEFIAGNLNDSDRAAVRTHLQECAACSQRLEEALTPPAEMTAAILARTVSPCESAQTQLPGYMDEVLPPLEAGLIHQHLEHCQGCSAVLAAMVRLEAGLDDWAQMEPPVGFSARVLAATTRKRQRPQPAHGWRAWWRGLAMRPRFAMEAAYLGALVFSVVLGFGGATSLDMDDIGESLQTIAIGTRSASETLDRKIVNLADDLFGGLAQKTQTSQTATQQLLREISKTNLAQPSQAPLNALHQNLIKMNHFLANRQEKDAP